MSNILNVAAVLLLFVKFISCVDPSLSPSANLTYIIPSGKGTYIFKYVIPQMTEVFAIFGKKGLVLAKIGSPPSNTSYDFSLSSDASILFITPQSTTKTVYFSVEGVGDIKASSDILYFVYRPITVVPLDYQIGSVTVPLTGKQGAQYADYYSITVPKGSSLAFTVSFADPSQDVMRVSIDRGTFGFEPFYISSNASQVIYSDPDVGSGTYYIIVVVNVVSATSYTIKANTDTDPTLPPLTSLGIATYVLTSIILCVVLCTVSGVCLLIILGYCFRSLDSKNFNHVNLQGEWYDNSDKLLTDEHKL